MPPLDGARYYTLDSLCWHKWKKKRALCFPEAILAESGCARARLVDCESLGPSTCGPLHLKLTGHSAQYGPHTVRSFQGSFALDVAWALELIGPRIIYHLKGIAGDCVECFIVAKHSQRAGCGRVVRGLAAGGVQLISDFFIDNRSSWPMHSHCGLTPRSVRDWSIAQ